MNIWHDIRKDRISKNNFIGVVEISKNGKNKYELDKETGMLKLDRVLYTATHYPTNYGFIPRTYAEDNDPLDVLILCNEEIQPLTLVECYPIGVLIMNDNGEEDEKIIAISKRDPYLNVFNDISALPNHISDEIKRFFEVYKQLEGKTTTVDRMLGREDAEKIIEKKLTVREVEKLIYGADDYNRKSNKKQPKTVYYQKIEDRLKDYFGYKVKLDCTKKHQRLVVEYNDEEGLESLLNKLDINI